MKIFNETMNKIKKKIPFNLLFVCSGNICRSVYAEYVFKNMVELSDILRDKICLNSGALSFRNRQIDQRTKKVLIEEGISISSIVKHKPKYIDDYSTIFEEADLIIGMTSKHELDLPIHLRNKFQMISQLAIDEKIDVGDPYWEENCEDFRNILLNLKSYLIELKNQFELFLA